MRFPIGYIWKTNKKKENEKEGRWAFLPDDLLQSISDQLPFLDLVSFRSVCRSWRTSPSGRSPIIKFPKLKGERFVLVYNYDGEGTCLLGHPGSLLECSFRVPYLRQVKNVFSLNGWLLAIRNDSSSTILFLCNPFTHERVYLPENPFPKSCSVKHTLALFFGGLPTSRNCTVVIFRLYDSKPPELSWCKVGDRSWKKQIFHDVEDFWRSKYVDYCKCIQVEDLWRSIYSYYWKNPCQCHLKGKFRIWNMLKKTAFEVDLRISPILERRFEVPNYKFRKWESNIDIVKWSKRFSGLVGTNKYTFIYPRF